MVTVQLIAGSPRVPVITRAAILLHSMQISCPTSWLLKDHKLNSECGEVMFRKRCCSYNLIRWKRRHTRQHLLSCSDTSQDCRRRQLFTARPWGYANTRNLALAKTKSAESKWDANWVTYGHTTCVCSSYSKFTDFWWSKCFVLFYVTYAKICLGFQIMPYLHMCGLHDGGQSVWSRKAGWHSNRANEQRY